MTEVQILGLALFVGVVAFALGHAAGYARAKAVERRRHDPARVMSSGPRYRRSSDVGRPE